VIPVVESILILPRPDDRSMSATLVERASDVLRREGVGPPPIDLVLVSVGLFAAGIAALWIAVLTQFAGPAVTTGVSPQTRAGLRWGSVGIIFTAAAVSLYQRRPIGWYGATALASVVFLFGLLRGIGFAALDLAVVLSSASAVAILLRRRDRFVT
jgi:hypothetical protein